MFGNDLHDLLLGSSSDGSESRPTILGEELSSDGDLAEIGEVSGFYREFVILSIG